MTGKRISHTAAYIAVKFYGLTLDEKLGSRFNPSIPAFYEKMIRFLPRHFSWYQRSLKSPFWRKLFILSEELLLPGDLMHIVCRKFFVTQLVDKAIAEGYEQLIVLGSGYDHLGVYASSQGITAFEVDMELMSIQKRNFVDKNGYDSDLLHMISLDASKRHLSDVLDTAPSFDTSKKTVFVAEGFFDYLTLANTKSVLDDLRKIVPKHRLITTIFSLKELNVFHRFMFTSGVALVGEALKLPLGKDGFSELLGNFGYSIQERLGHVRMRREFIEPSGVNLPVLKGFYVMEADS